MLFSWPCVLVGLTRKWFEVKIFTSNHFWTHAQREKEREIAPRSRYELRAQSPSTSHHSTSTSNPTQVAPFDFASKPRAQDRTPSTSPTSHTFVFAEIAPITLRSHPRIAPRRHRLHRSHWDRNWEMVGFWWIWPDLMNFFWLGFVSTFIYWEMVLYICLEAEKMWENVKNNKKMCFLYYFQQHNQTLENIFQSIFWNATKHLKIFSFLENSISKKYFTWTKLSLNLLKLFTISYLAYLLV